MATLFKNKNGQYTVTLPKDVVETLGWKKGQELYIGKEREKNIVFIEEKRK